MTGRVIWRTRRSTRAGKLLYMVLDTGGREPYGLAIVGPAELAMQEHVDASAARMRQWCRRLAHGHVRPCHLREMIVEWLCE